jgi:hypothetical protein
MTDQGILDVIGVLAAEAASGRLQVTSGMTEGALFFDRGQLVDVRMGKLTGFQAINALASVRDASFNFDPTIAPPVESSITTSERVLLKDFFGIDAADTGVGWVEEHAPPARVVPLAEVQAQEAADEAEVTLVGRAPTVTEPPVFHQPLARSAFRPALFVLLAALVTVTAVVLLYRFRQPASTAAVAPATQTAPPAEIPQAPQPEIAAPEITAAVPDLSGNWNVVNTVEQTSYEAYRNMKIGFNVSINQAGNEFTGKGEKISENGRSLPAGTRTPILVKGTIDGDKVEATFSENGAVRKTNGRFVWRIDKGSGGLTGTFVSTAARARGKSAATKAFVGPS